MQSTTPTTHTPARACVGTAAAVAMLFATTTTAWAATYTVNSAYDDGLNINPNFCLPGETCTLRAAIQLANQDAAPDTIHFAIPIAGNGLATISPLSALPTIVQPLTIDGYTQPGSSPNTLAVGNDAVINVRIDGVYAGDSNGLVFTAPDSVLRGVAVTRFGINAVVIQVNGNASAKVAGNFIGTDGSGSAQDASGALLSGGVGILIGSGAGSVVGGATPADRNLILGDTGVVLTGGVPYTTVQGNYIGTDRSGNAPRRTGNGVAVTEGAGSNTIKNNVIGALHNGVMINGPSMSNSVMGNRIGIGEGGVSIAGDGHGVWIGDPFSNQGPQNNNVGGIANGQPNFIGYWGGWGVRVEQKDPGVAGPAQANAIIGNGIYPNAAGGIQLVGGANRGQAAPEFSGAVTKSGGTASAPVTLQGQPNTAYRLEFFTNAACHPSGFGEGKVATGFIAMVTTDASGQYSGTVQGIPANVGNVLTMTARLPATGDTSQFSACATVASAGAVGTPPVMNLIPDVALPVGTYQELSLPNMVTPTDGDTITGYALSGTLPPGMGFNTVTGILSGTPNMPGIYTLQATATDKDGTSAPRSFTVTVTPQQGGGGGNPGDPGGNPGGPGGPGGNVAAVPALGPAGLGLMSLLVAGMGALRRRKN